MSVDPREPTPPGPLSPSAPRPTSWRASLRTRVGSLALDVQLEGDNHPLALVGPNGSGKTTVLKLLAGAVPAERADIEVGGVVLARSQAPARTTPIESREVGYVPQTHSLFPHLSVLENVVYGLSMSARGLGRAERHRRAQEMLDALECADLAQRSALGLSGGEQQRVALARALVVSPRLLLLDEPLAALDATTRNTVRRVLARVLAQRSVPAVIVTHDVQDVIALGARVCVLDAGTVIQTGSLEDLRAAPASPFVQAFLGQAFLDQAFLGSDP